MRLKVLRKLPKFIRLDENHRIEYAWKVDDHWQQQFQECISGAVGAEGLSLERLEQIVQERGLLSSQSALYGYQVPGSVKQLIIVNEQRGERPFAIETVFSLELLGSLMASPQTVINTIAEWVMDTVRFERFDLIRVNRSLLQFTFEFSMGIDIEEAQKSAYKKISDSGLGWVFYQETPYLVEHFTPEIFRFQEDPWLYRLGSRSVLRVPIIFDQRTIGAIMLTSTEPGHFQVEDAFVLEQLGRAVGRAFFHAGILEEREYQTRASSTLLQTLARSIGEAESAAFLKTYCQEFLQMVKVESVAVHLVDEANQRYRNLAHAGKALTGPEEWQAMERDPVLKEMVKARAIVAVNLGEARSYQNCALSGQGITSVLYAPIVDGKDRIRACLVVGCADELALSKQMAGLCKIATEQLAIILSQSVTSTDVGERKRTRALEKPKGFEAIVGSSRAIMETVQKAAAAAQYEFPILLTGETGTGKELFAKAIHRSSPVAKGPFIVVNSAAIPENLLESELFGYREGVFPGGLKGGKKGKILLADGGTLFLDEIGELPLDLQAKLLRVIQEKEVEPLGADKPVPVKVRIVSATHRNLKEMVEQGTFREDLYYRLNSIEIHIPPLRERGQDVLELAESMLDSLAKETGKRRKRLSQDVKRVLMEYEWPGNVRQLQNVINWAFVFAPEDEITVNDLPPEILGAANRDGEESERARLERLLQEFGGNKTALANHLGLSRTGLWKKLKRLGLQ